MTCTRWLLVCGISVATALPAQEPQPHLGVGMAWRSGDRIEGVGPAFLAARPVVTHRAVAVRAELAMERLALRGSPQSCVLVEQRYCFGREDRLASLSSGLALTVDVSGGEPFAIYVIPMAVAVRFSSTVTSETRGPTLLCFVGGQVVSCPENPPFEHREQSRSGAWLSVGAGFGVRRDIRSLSFDVQMRAASVPDLGRGVGLDIGMLVGRRLVRSRS